MKKINLQDERILSQRRKIQSDAYQILMYCLAISMIIQQFILNAPFPQFAVEFFCFIGMGIYITIRHLTAGIDIWNSTEPISQKVLINGATSGVISVVLIATLAGERDVRKLVIFFLCVTSINFITNIVLQHINNKRQKQIDDKLNYDESNL